MSIAGFPTSSDIYLEVDGIRVAVVQSYAVKTTKSSTVVEAFGEAEPVEGGVIVRWDVALDKSGVDYTLYYQKTPFDFAADPNLTAAERRTLVPEVGKGYGYQAQPESYPYQALIQGLEPGETYYFAIRAKDRSPSANEEKNTVAVEAVPLG